MSKLDLDEAAADYDSISTRNQSKRTMDESKLKVTALVTARGTNTLANKHLVKIDGKPLVWYALRVAKNCPSISSHYLSSDDDKILQVGREEGYSALKRPDQISLPSSMHIDAITHALKEIAGDEGGLPEILVVLLGNTVCFRPEWIEESVMLLRDNKHFSAVVPVYLENDHHPYRAKYIDQQGYLKPYFDFSSASVSTNRQDLPSNYFLCHNFWALRVESSVRSPDGQPPWTFMGNQIKPLVVERGPDVHEEGDVALCELWVKRNKGSIT